MLGRPVGLILVHAGEVLRRVNVLLAAALLSELFEDGVDLRTVLLQLDRGPRMEVLRLLLATEVRAGWQRTLR